MLEVAVGLLAGLLILAGVLIMFGPSLGRGLRLARRGRAPIFNRRPGTRTPKSAKTELHPTTVRSLAVADRIQSLLKEHRLERQSTSVRNASRRLREEETDGIYAMQEALRRLQPVRLEDHADQAILEGLARQLGRNLSDRAEQLELLPRR
ncbi:MAG: hypothetical protein M3024_07980 [Candidatus Dormibacteraeota bacterium]|nr:hypothetical protein [Candidatus Dormibacteraeota bacterium]